MALSEELTNHTSLPQSVLVSVGSTSLTASTITNPLEYVGRHLLEDPPPSKRILSLWDDKEHMQR